MGYEIHAKAEDLESLAQRLAESVDQFRSGGTPFQRQLAAQGFPPRPGDPVWLFSEYITLSQERTDRTTLSFHAAPSLDEHHRLFKPRMSAASIGGAFGKLLWFVALPLIGIATCFVSLLRAL
jgi:hypothetical protein